MADNTVMVLVGAGLLALLGYMIGHYGWEKKGEAEQKKAEKWGAIVGAIVGAGAGMMYGNKKSMKKMLFGGSPSGASPRALRGHYSSSPRRLRHLAKHL